MVGAPPLFSIWRGDRNAPTGQVAKCAVVVVDTLAPVVAEGDGGEVLALCRRLHLAWQTGVTEVAFQHLVGASLGQFS